jgi:hypothetical protein
MKDHNIAVDTCTDASTLPPLISTQTGMYRHYKGGLYEVIGTVRHSEDLSPMTLYRALYGEAGLWVRPAAMFNEKVLLEGVLRPRFTYLGVSASSAAMACG